MSTKSTPRTKSKRRVVVTGMGAVTPLGCTMTGTWQGIVAGRSPAGPIRRFDASGFPTQIAYEVPEFGLDDSRLTDEDGEYLNPVTTFGYQAASEALTQARLWEDDTAPERKAICLGIGMCSPDLEWYNKVYLPRRFEQENLIDQARLFPDVLAAILARVMCARGGTTTVHTACASSGQALGEAFELVAYGDADLVLTGGADSMINPLYLAGFSLLGAMSRRNDDPTTASRPFDAERDGFVLGEGACMLVFEELEHAQQRQAPILAEVLGYGITASAFRITDLHPEGRGPKEAMERALIDGGVSPEDVGYLNAHGTSTPLNDRIEAQAIGRVFCPDRCNLRVSSTKSMTGHMISAAGAIEFAITAMALLKQTLPPTINVFQSDKECRIRLTESPDQTKSRANLEYGLSNSVGFGGSNTALLVGRYHG